MTKGQGESIGAKKAGVPPPSRAQATIALRCLLRHPTSSPIQPNQRQQTTNGQNSLCTTTRTRLQMQLQSHITLLSVTSGCGSCSTRGRPESRLSPTHAGEPRDCRCPPRALTAMLNPCRRCCVRRRSPRRPPPGRWSTYLGSPPLRRARRRRPLSPPPPRPRRTPRFLPRGRRLERRRPCRRGLLLPLLWEATSGPGWWRCRRRT